MQKSTESKIRSVRYYDCGRCFNQLALIYRGHKPENRAFPSGVFLIDHSEYGLILFDTGYSESIFSTGVKGWLYRRLNPTKVSRQDEIATQLRADGIDLAEVKTVVLSHLHPDHIGGIKFFPEAEFVLTHEAFALYKKPAFKDLVFKQMIPRWFAEQCLVLADYELKETELAGLTGFDFFGDGSLLLTPLPGHSRGHLGALVNGSLLLAGDACWGTDLMCCSSDMRAVGQLIQHDYSAYLDSITQLRQASERGIRLCFAHDHYSTQELLG